MAGSDYEAVFVSKLAVLNTLRILASPSLRRAGSIYCKRSGRFGRLCFGGKLRPIPDHYYASFGGSNWPDFRSRVILGIAEQLFSSETDRYVRRFFHQVLVASLGEPIGLLQDYQLLDSEKGRCAVLVPFGPFFSIIKSRYESPRCDVLRGFGARRVRDAAIRWGLYTFSVLQALWCIISSADRRQGTASPALCVLNFRGGQTFKDRHDFFWMTSDSLEFPAVFEYPAKTYALGDEYRKALRDRGVRIVETHRWKRAFPDTEQWRPGSVFLRRLFSVNRSRGVRGWWASVQRLAYSVEVAARIDFYERYNIRALLISGFTPLEAVHSGAMREVGGMTSVVQYTLSVGPLGGDTSTATFHLNFGDSITAEKFPLIADFTVLNGYTFKTVLAGRRDKAEALRESMRQRGVRRSVSFFDEGTLENEDLDRVTFGFCEFLLRKIVADTGFAVVIKPKRDTTVPGLKKGLGALYDQAAATGRLVVLDRTYYPGVAAMATDLSVGLLGAAPVESALMGARTIYLNPFGYLPSFMRGIRQHIYDSWGEATAAVALFLDGKAPADFGVHPEAFLKSVDAARDDEVSHRIEFILFSCLRQIREGIPAEIASKNTASELCRRWPVRCLGEPVNDECSLTGVSGRG